MRIWSAGYWRRPYERANRAQARIAPQTGFAETQDSGTDAAERSGLALSPRSRSARDPMGHRRIDRGRIGRHGLDEGLAAADRMGTGRSDGGGGDRKSTGRNPSH